MGKLDAAKKIASRLASKSDDAEKAAIELYSRENLPKKVKLPKQHLPSADVGVELGENHRLNTVDDIQYAVKDGKVIGHVGRDEDGAVKALWVDPEHRRKGVAESMYKRIAENDGVLKSDELDAMEPGAQQLWKKLQVQFPDSVKKTDQGYTFTKPDPSKIAKKMSGANSIARDPKAEALKVLSKFDNVEAATALKGPERKAYLDALDTVYGDKSKRASDIGEDLEYLKRVHKKADVKAKKNKTQSYGGDDVDFTGADDGQMEAYLAKNPGHRPKSFGVDVGGEYAGSLEAGRTPGQSTIHIKDVNIDDQFQRKGGATEMYRAAEREFGLPLEPGVTGLSDDSKALWANPDRPFGHKRVPDAAFDPRFKDSANILALTGSQAPKIAARMIKPEFSLGKAFSDITEPIDKLDAPVNQMIDSAATKFGQLTDLTGGKDLDHQDRAATAFNLAAGMIAPTPSNLLMGGAGKVLPIMKGIKGAAVAEGMTAKQAPKLISAPKAESTAQMYLKAREAGYKPHGQTIVRDTEPAVGKVILKP